jgi:hypothetical protein
MELAGLCSDCDATIQKSIEATAEIQRTPTVDLGENILLKSGKYGTYVERDGTRKPTRGKTKVSLEEAKQILTTETPKSNANVLRTLDAEYSVRKGKYGVYVLHERKGAKPVCHNIRKFRESFLECEAQTLIDWVKSISVV